MSLSLLLSSWMRAAKSSGDRLKVCTVTAPLKASDIMAAAACRCRPGGFPNKADVASPTSGKGSVSQGFGRNQAKNFSATVAVAILTKSTAQQAVEPKICSANQPPSKIENSSSNSIIGMTNGCEAVKNAHPPQLKSLPWRVKGNQLNSINITKECKWQ